MRSCVSCGGELAAYAVFCQKCGKIQSISPLTQSDKPSFKVTSPDISSFSTTRGVAPVEPEPAESALDVPSETEIVLPVEAPDEFALKIPEYERITAETSMFADILVEDEFASPDETPIYVKPPDAEKDTADDTTFMVGHVSVPIRDESAGAAKPAFSGKTESILLKTFYTDTARDVTSKQPTAAAADPMAVPSHAPDGSYQGKDHDSQYYDRLASQVFSAKTTGAADERYLKSFSFGPGCSLYFLSRAMGFFIGITIVAIIGWLIAFPTHGSDAAQNTHVKLLFLATLPLLIWAGKVARRLRWKKLGFRDFEHFKSNETIWQIFGCLGWLVYLVFAIALLSTK